MEKAVEKSNYFHGYISLTGPGTVQEELRRSQEMMLSTLHELTEAQWMHRYAPEKWSVKEVVQHCIDTERIMTYRGLAFARGEEGALPGYDENAYAALSDADRRDPSFILSEYEVVRASTVMLFDSFSDEMLFKEGTFSGNSVLQVIHIGRMVAGHDLHHLGVIKERYLRVES
ncbi:MAG: DinB family protein [Flavobacteriales bacterium]|nr:DinB family protein [Flavobacteriales bacterium]